MPLQDGLDALKADFENGKRGFKPDADVLDAMHRSTAELIASGQALNAKKAGDTAPGFTLKDTEGRLVSSSDFLVSGPLIVSFYRGAWCPYCSLDFQAVQAALPAIEARGARLIALSPQTAAKSRKARRDNKLTFPILADEKSRVAAAFGLRFSLPDYLVELYRGFRNDLPAFNDDPAWVLPMPARYVIGSDGIIAYAEVNPDYTQRPDPSELLLVLDKLRITEIA